MQRRRSTMRHIAGIGLLTAAIATPFGVSQTPPPASTIGEVAITEVAQDSAVIDLAICLDVSGSMSGLIEAAKQKLWAIVNDLALAEPTPKLRVALLTYGHDTYDPEDGWVALQTELTDDLDLVSDRLFSLSTNGGTEYVGRVVYSALEQLEWMEGDESLKLIVVAGNESADQDQQTPFRDVCRRSISEGIMVNAIYCGNPADNIAPGWREVAQLADGHFAAIDHDNGTVVVSTPFDDQLADLSTTLNATYIAYGAQGEWGKSQQTLQDQNALGLNSANAAQRAQTKANALYNCSWDLIDACRAETVKIEEVKEEDLPENMRTMTMEERIKHVDEMYAKRQSIQNEINDVSKKRQAYVTQQMREAGLKEDQAFDFVIRKAIRAQAALKGFQFVDEEPAESVSAEPAGEQASSGEEPQTDAGGDSSSSQEDGC